MTEQAKLHLKPADGLRIPNPETGRDLSADGEFVTNTTYWRRLLRSKEVVEVEQTTTTSAASAKKGK